MATNEHTVSIPADGEKSSNVIPIRPGGEAAANRAERLAEVTEACEDLDRRTGYSGTIQGGTLDEALDEQRAVLWDAQAIIETVAQALERQFGRDWPAGDMPIYPRVLRRAAALIDEATGALEAGVLEDRAIAISRARDEEAPEGSPEVPL